MIDINLAAKIIAVVPELINLKQWVCFNLKEKTKKVPQYFDGHQMCFGDSGDPKKWMTFNDAIKHYNNPRNNLDGVGFVFTKELSLIGIDLDDCRDPLTNTYTPFAQNIIDQFKTYADISPSTKGVHIYCKGIIPRVITQGTLKLLDGQKIEIYDCGRYFTFTSNKINDYPINNCQEALDALYLSLGIDPKPKPQDSPSMPPESNPGANNGHPKPLEDMPKVIQALNKLSQARCDTFDSWIKVGMALRDMGAIGYGCWEEWSKKSAKFEQDCCDKHWKSMTKDSIREKKITLGSLFYWAEEDSPSKVKIEPLILDPKAKIDSDLFESLFEENQKFKQTWSRKRKDKNFEHGRQKDYDLALIGFGIHYRLDNQTIANMIIVHRRKHDQEVEEICSNDYIPNLIARMRNVNNEAIEEKEQKEIEEDTINSMCISLAEEMKKDDLCDGNNLKDYLSKGLKIEITKLIRFVSDNPTFRLYTDKGEIPLSMDDMDNPAPFRKKINTHTKKRIPKLTTKQWDIIAQSLLDISEDHGIGADISPSGTAEAWLNEYIYKTEITLSDNAENVNAPFIRHGYLYIFGSYFRRWIKTSYGEEVNRKEMGIALRALGCIPEVLHRSIDDKQTKRNVWKIPRTIYNPSAETAEKEILP